MTGIHLLEFIDILIGFCVTRTLCNALRHNKIIFRHSFAYRVDVYSNTYLHNVYKTAAFYRELVARACSPGRTRNRQA